MDGSIPGRPLLYKSRSEANALNLEAEQTAIAFTRRCSRPSPRELRPRAYQTGDTALLEEQGELHFMGRRDKQVNVRSQRVELADIEHNLVDSVPGITSAAVIIGMSSPPKTVAFVKSRLRKSTREDIAAHFTSYQPSLAADARLRD